MRPGNRHGCNDYSLSDWSDCNIFIRSIDSETIAVGYTACPNPDRANSNKNNSRIGRCLQHSVIDFPFPL